MTTVKGPQPGVTQELLISREPPARFLVGLGWDPKEYPRVDLKLPPGPQDVRGVGGWIWYVLTLPFRFVITLVRAALHMEAVKKYEMDAGKAPPGLSRWFAALIPAAEMAPEDAIGRDRESPTYDLDLDCYVFGADKALKAVITVEDNAVIDPSGKVYHSGENYSGQGGPDDEQLFVETAGLPEDYRHFFFVVKSDSSHPLGGIPGIKARLADGKSNANALENAVAPPDAVAYAYVFCHVFRDVGGWKFRNIDEYDGDGVEWEQRLAALIGD